MRLAQYCNSRFGSIVVSSTIVAWLGVSIVALIAALVVVSDADAAPPVRVAPSITAAIGATMDRSIVAWSAGDLDAFMDSYEDSPDTLFVGSTGVVHGKAAIKARYATTFGGGGPGSLGALSFETLEIRPLGPEHALMIGRYHLQPQDAAKPAASGIFSLVFHRRGGQWRIVCDHTS